MHGFEKPVLAIKCRMMAGAIALSFSSACGSPDEVRATAAPKLVASPEGDSSPSELGSPYVRPPLPEGMSVLTADDVRAYIKRGLVVTSQPTAFMQRRHFDYMPGKLLLTTYGVAIVERSGPYRIEPDGRVIFTEDNGAISPQDTFYFAGKTANNKMYIIYHGLPETAESQIWAQIPVEIARKKP
jgi:hypothetical protein